MNIKFVGKKGLLLIYDTSDRRTSHSTHYNQQAFDVNINGIIMRYYSWNINFQCQMANIWNTDCRKMNEG